MIQTQQNAFGVVATGGFVCGTHGALYVEVKC